ncbi:hypothetical protein ACKVEX_16455 [Rhodocyclaceae bacterium SMB388]
MLLRVLLLVNLLAVATVLVREADVHTVPAALLVMAGVIELPLFLAVLLLYLLQPVLRRLSYPAGVGVVLGVVAVVSVAVFMLLGADQAATLMRWLLWAVLAAAVCLFYFDTRSQRFSPALIEARLLQCAGR